MPVETDEDRAGMLADFGSLVTIDDGADPANTFMAIFDNAFIAAEFPGTAGVASREPMMLARSSDVDELPTDTGLTIADVADAYVLKETQPDGTGFSLLILEKA